MTCEEIARLEKENAELRTYAAGILEELRKSGYGFLLAYYEREGKRLGIAETKEERE